jgi:PilZ domain
MWRLVFMASAAYWAVNSLVCVWASTVFAPLKINNRSSIFKNPSGLEEGSRVFTNIALVAPQVTGREVQAIREQLRHPMRFTVREFLSLEEVCRGLKNFPFDILVMRLHQFDLQHVNTIRKVHGFFTRAGIVTVSPEIHPQARAQVREFNRHKLLLEPMELQDLTRVVEKFSRGEGSPARLHPRILREEECEIVDTENDLRFPAKFIDFAQMGARIKVQLREPLKIHSRVQIHYRSTTEPGRVHKIESKIVWGQVSSGMMGTIVKGPAQTLGLRFIAAI